MVEERSEPSGRYLKGPYVQAALICEKALQEADGTLSVIRIVDRHTMRASGPEPPESMPAHEVHFYLVVMLKAGEAIGSGELEVEPELPSGLRQRRQGTTVHMGGEERGHNWIIELKMQVEEVGLYWFNIYYDGALISRIPLRVRYERHRA